MDATEQAAGERRVREVLIEPLLALGLSKPAGLTKARFEEGLRTLQQMLAYMAKDELVDLRERVERNPGGKDRDRFPIPLKIKNMARDMSPPSGGDASPFLGNVMASPVGDAALAGGYAPELLAYIRPPENRGKWPGPYTISQVRANADDARRRFDDLQMRQHRGGDLSADDRAFLDRRSAAIAECRRIAAIGKARRGQVESGG